MGRTLTLIALFLVLALPAHSLAQESASPPKENKPDPAIEKKAFDWLGSIAEQIPSLHAPTNRVRVEGVIADLLWTRDEKRARALIKSAGDEIIARTAEVDFSDRQVYQDLGWLNQQRQELALRIAEHDPALAIAFLRETRVQPPDGGPKWWSETEINIEMQLAQRIANKDPEHALAIARAVLAHGFSWNLMGLLNQIQQKDPKSAQTLYKEMVARIKDEDLERNQQAASSAWSLLSSFQPPQADEETYRDLMATLINAALNIHPGNQNSLNAINQMNSLMPQIQKYAPERAAAVKQWSDNAERMSDPTSRMYREMSQIGQNGTVEDMLAAALKYPREFQNQLYQQAAWKAFSGGDVARARQIVSEFVTDPVQRRQILDQFENQSLSSAVDQNKIDEARRLMSKIKNVDQRVQLSSRLAMQLAAKGDKKAAVDVLNELRTFVDSMPQNSYRMSMQMQLARIYSSLDLDRSFEIVQPLVVKMNELVAAAAVLDGFDQRYTKDGEWLITGPNSLGNVINNLEQTLSVLAPLDFDRARALADQFEKPEIRLMAELEIAQSALGHKSPWMGGRGGEIRALSGGIVTSRGMAIIY